MREALVMNGRKLYAFVLMKNHAHLLAMGEAPGRVSGLMQSVGRSHVRYVNASCRRSGTLFKASLVESERYLLRCMHYIDLNPVRAGMVTEPGD
ncbi:hypothetical protein EWI61_08750 [Methylolobus aquaticus]|nr:hypothetical protein EWI61_08750 [Methylolobus aquaticus]